MGVHLPGLQLWSDICKVGAIQSKMVWGYIGNTSIATYLTKMDDKWYEVFLPYQYFSVCRALGLAFYLSNIHWST